MDGSWLTGTELQLTRERSLKYKGTAKVYINQIVTHPSISRGLDPKNVDRLCKIFGRDRCRRLDVRNHVTAVVSRQHLEMALASAGVSTIALMTNPPDRYPLLEFPVGQVQCLHGQHRLKAAEELLPPSDQWWTVDLYLDGGQDSDPLPSTALFCSSRHISSNLQAALVDEYSNEKVPSDGEVYLKVRQYQQEGNARFEERWMARLSANKAKRFRQLNSHVDVRAAFDRLRIIPALLLQGMKFGSIPRALATNCYEEMAHGLGSLLESWSYYVRGDRAKMLKIDPHTVEKLQGLAPSVSVKDAKVIKGLVVSGQVFSNFTSSERKALYAMRHYPQIPREQTSDDLVAKPGHEKADEIILHDMAVLAQRLGFDSPHIQNLIQRSPDQQMARDILLKARKPDRYQYPEDIFESLVTRICDCFSEAVSLDHPASPEPAMAREAKLKRYGLPHRNAQRQDSRLLFLDELHTNNVPLDTRVTTFFVRRCFYFAFFGQLPEALPPSPARTSSPSSDGSLTHSPIFVPDGRSLAPASSVISPIQRRRESRIDGQSRRDVARQDRRRRKQEAKERRRQERRRRQELRRSHRQHDRSPTIQNIDDHDMEEIPRPPVIHPERPECIEGERTSMEVNSPVIPSNADQNDHEEMEESEGFNSDSEHASTATHVQFGEESEAAPDREDRALTGVVERMSTEKALAQSAADATGDLEMELQRELDRLQRDAEESVKDAEQGNQGAGSPAAEHALPITRVSTGVEGALEEGTVHSNDQTEARQELLQEALVEMAEHQDVGSIASTDRSDTPSKASNKKAMTNKEKRQGGIGKWAPYDATTNGNRRADRGQRITRVDFTELGLNELSASNVLQPAIEVHTENVPIRPEDRLVETEGLDRSEVLPTALGKHTVPDIAIHPIAEQADTPVAPFESEVVEPPQNFSDEGRVPAAADLVMVEAASQTLKASSMKSAQIKGRGQITDPKWVPYDQTRKENRERAARHTPGRGPQRQQHTRPVTQITFSGMQLAPPQQPPETEASAEHGLGVGHAPPSGEHQLSLPTVTQLELPPTTEDAQSPMANTISQAPTEVRLITRAEEQRLSGTWEKQQRRFSRPMGIKKAREKAKVQDRQHRTKQAGQHTRPVTQITFSEMGLAPPQQPPETEASTKHGLLHPETTISVDLPPLPREHQLPLSAVTHLEVPPSTEDAAQSPMVNTFSDQAPSEVRLITRDDKQRISERWEKRQSRFSRPMGIKKTREKARAQDRQNRNKQARQNQGPVTESSGPVIHQDGQESRVEKAVTRINFENWAKTMVQEEHEVSSMPAPEPPTELRARTASPGDQPKTVTAQPSQAATARSDRKIFKPPAQEVLTAPSEPNPISQAVTITFRARGDDGRWKTVHELQVNPSDPSDVERIARKDARNRNATFYDKNLRKLTPAQCFEAAIEDGTNTIFMQFDGELVMDEETMESIVRIIEL
ncbi:hypothetical protein IFM53868_08512 [Aspergillus udagawae]|uniref:Uncharacterized protein n=1 Tax=Aspergillus udagawae TaxID=91492 RepID=A0ABQ1B8Z0_9EURO|nr:hypothetical protein IFM53868_08512 [Aspergillus udagawae]